MEKREYHTWRRRLRGGIERALELLHEPAEAQQRAENLLAAIAQLEQALDDDSIARGPVGPAARFKQRKQ
jgi:hypothetical protein